MVHVLPILIVMLESVANLDGVSNALIQIIVIHYLEMSKVALITYAQPVLVFLHVQPTGYVILGLESVLNALQIQIAILM